MYSHAWIVVGGLLSGAVLFRSWLHTASRYTGNRRNINKRVQIQALETVGLLGIVLILGFFLTIAVSGIRELINISDDMGQVSDSVQTLTEGNTAERGRIEGQPAWSYLTYTGTIDVETKIDAFKNALQTNPEQYNQLIDQLSAELRNDYGKGAVTESELMWVGKNIELDGVPYCITAGYIPSQEQLYRDMLSGNCDLAANYGNIAGAGNGEKLVSSVAEQTGGDILAEEWFVIVLSTVLAGLGATIPAAWWRYSKAEYRYNTRHRKQRRRATGLNAPHTLQYSGTDTAIRGSINQIRKASQTLRLISDRWAIWLPGTAGIVTTVAVLTVGYNTTAAPTWELLIWYSLLSSIAGMTVTYMGHVGLRRIELHEQRKVSQIQERLLGLEANTSKWWEPLLMRYSSNDDLSRKGAGLIANGTSMETKVAIRVEPQLGKPFEKLDMSLDQLLENMKALVEEKPVETRIVTS